MLIRPLQPADRELLVAGFEQLSPESRYRRFFSPVVELTERQLDYLTHVDQHDHVALVAVDKETGEALGVARFVRTGPGVAEPAIVVVDAHQGHGIGSALLERLVARAKEEGVTQFVAPVLADNPGAIAVLRQLGDTAIEHSGREVELTIELPTEPASRTAGVRALLRVVAAGAVSPGMVFWHRLRPRRGEPREMLRNAIVCDASEASIAVTESLVAATGAAAVVVAARNPLADEDEALDDQLERAAARLRRQGAEVRSVRRRGDLGAILLDEAILERGRLIVVADEGGDEGVAVRLIGSVWDHVSHHAPCDVLIARRKRADFATR